MFRLSAKLIANSCVSVAPYVIPAYAVFTGGLMVQKCLEVSYDLLQKIANKKGPRTLKIIPPKKVNEFYSRTSTTQQRLRHQIKPSLKRLGTTGSRFDYSRRKRFERFKDFDLCDSSKSGFSSPTGVVNVVNKVKDDSFQEGQITHNDELSDESIDALVKKNFSPCKGLCQSCSVSPIHAIEAKKNIIIKLPRKEESSILVNLEARIKYGGNNEAILVLKGLPSKVILKKVEIAQLNEVKTYDFHLDEEVNGVTTHTKIGKYWNFVKEPMREKEVTDLAGIGPVLGKQLKMKGFDKAFEVFGKFLLLKKNKESFVKWIQENTKANRKQAGDCYQCLYAWCKEFL